MSSRLDRLFVLLETGGSGVTRRAAAQQLGEVVRLHPHDLNHLLTRLHTYLHSKSWETRIAAGLAVEAIVSNIPQWTPQPLQQNADDLDEETLKKSFGRLSLKAFNIKNVLQKGSYLMAADEKQFEAEDENIPMDPVERLKCQRQLVNQRLGLDIAQAIGVDTQHLFSNEDLVDTRTDLEDAANGQERDAVVNVVRCEMRSAGLSLSSREMNRARRKAKLMARQKSMDVSDSAGDDGPERKRMKLQNYSQPDNNGSDDEDKMVVDEGPVEQGTGDEAIDWPLENFCDILATDLFSSSWEVRHGAATALRHIVRVQGRGGGKTKYQTKEQMFASHQAWLEDMAVRLVCVLALDRFGDFVSDQVVAPVRETCAQVLGGVLHLVGVDGVLGVLGLLEALLSWREWEARHGGLLGLKYLLAVRDDLRVQLLTHSYPHIYKGLVDEMDDVVAVAAACLVPVADSVVGHLDAAVLATLVLTLWDALLDIDDLTSSTNSILLLLSNLLSHLSNNVSIYRNLSEFVPRLWPFLYHNSSSVRKSALITLATLTADTPIDQSSCDDASSTKEVKGETEQEQNDMKTGVAGQVQCEKEESQAELKQDDKKENCDSVEDDCKMKKIEEIKVENSDIKEDTENHKENESIDETSVKTENIDSKMKQDKKPEKCFDWLNTIIQPALTHIYQRALLETSAENIDLVFKIWQQMLVKVPLDTLLPAVCPLVASWLCLMMANPKVPLEPSLLLIAHHSKSGEGKRLRVGALNDPVDKSDVKYYLGGCEQFGDSVEKQKLIVRARCAAAKLLGRLSYYVIQPMPGVEYPPDETPVLCYVRLLTAHLSSRSAIQRLAAAAVVREWALTHPGHPCHDLLTSVLHTCLTEVVYYDEIALSFTRLQQETRDFMAMLRHYKLTLDEAFISAPVLTLEQIQSLSGPVSLTLFNGARLRPKVHTTLDERRRAIQNNVSQTSADQVILSTTTQSMIGGAVVRFHVLPDKLSPIIKPLMESIKKEKVEQLQRVSADDLTKLLELCHGRATNPSAKVIKNLASFLCVDHETTPKIPAQDTNTEKVNKQVEIISLSSQIKNAEKQLLKRSSSISGRGPGRPPANAKKEDPSEMTEAMLDSEMQQLAEIQRRGCSIALMQIAQYFGEELPVRGPQLWKMLREPFDSPLAEDASVEACQEAVHWLQLLEVVIPALHHNLTLQLKDQLACMGHWLYHRVSAVRHMASRVIGALARVVAVPAMTFLVEEVVPALFALDHDTKRQGAVECIHAVIDQLGFEVVPYIVFLIVPLLGRMSDPNSSVRLLSTHCFATLVQLMPLEGGVPDPPTLSQHLLTQKQRERQFLERLLDPSKIDGYKIPVKVNAELRSYQQNGVNWLSFLNQYKLHGILCDDMGLGKTLQSICILAGDHHTKEAKHKGEGDSGASVQSLVVCPPTLTGHWVYEVEKFVSKQYLNPLHYYGPPTERYKLRNFFPDHNLIVASYDIVRNDIDFFSQIKWNYVILDEGHVIKNGKTKSSKAIKQLVAHHRLILSGTPIQNNVLELWSLFDFLMPGFLGTERQFTARYAKPILQSRDAKSSSKEQAAGVLAMEALHRQVLPFILRRVKEDVLQDLPPKITQDYYCDLSPLQQQLYEDFSRSQAQQDISQAINCSNEQEIKSKSHSHIFQALQYLRKVCNHPKLVLKPQHPEYEPVIAHLRNCNSSLADITHSAKLPALKQLLVDCGIGVSDSAGSESVVSQHRALVFCQLKAMLDIIENDLLRSHLPNVTYLRLDGSVPAGSRHELVQRFNADPSIDLLLLTTQVGGLGLNLVGADTVIFVEHDWNPMRDLQAMDRAHRIGQKRVVNVYRLITRGTLEEKIMGLQKFKMMTANTVISQENSSLLSMATNQLLDLFTFDSGEKGGRGKAGEAQGSTSQTLGVTGSGAKAVLENLPELWDEHQYEKEYEMTSFMQALKK